MLAGSAILSETLARPHHDRRAGFVVTGNALALGRFALVESDVFRNGHEHDLLGNTSMNRAW
ncbi:hypothetical protein [Thiorhodococcus fuscus]|uniref:Uncharacterized protein n=1 Tax=Thiorhodococcus fuscus TaxID=527200 RepID=A0ABW4Y8Q0_9GAMM